MKLVSVTGSGPAMVDDDDYESISRYRWYVSQGYPERSDWAGGANRKYRMHRDIMGLSPGDGQMVDHRNGNPLDNRRDNLRLASHGQNMVNTKIRKDNKTGYKGVMLAKNGRWHVELWVRGKKLYLGRYKTKIAGAIAYNIAAIQHHGEFARLNQVFSGEVV